MRNIGFDIVALAAVSDLRTFRSSSICLHMRICAEVLRNFCFDEVVSVNGLPDGCVSPQSVSDAG